MFDFIISDTHYGHRNILKYEPMREAWGQTVEEMTETMVQAWNAVVGPNDTVLHCGDVAMGPRDVLMSVVKRLNGRKTLVFGNHDRKPEVMLASGFERVVPSFEFEYRGLQMLVKHDPEHFDLNEDFWNRVYVHGHTHSLGLAPFIPQGRGICACVEILKSPAPVPLAPLIEGLGLPMA